MDYPRRRRHVGSHHPTERTRRVSPQQRSGEAVHPQRGAGLQRPAIPHCRRRRDNLRNPLGNLAFHGCDRSRPISRSGPRPAVPRGRRIHAIRRMPHDPQRLPVDAHLGKILHVAQIDPHMRTLPEPVRRRIDRLRIRACA